METTTKKSFSEYSDEERKVLVLKQLFSVENSKNENNIYCLSYADKANSGYSIGKTQIDLGQNPKKVDEIMTAMATYKEISEDDRKKIGEGLKVIQNPNALSDELKKKFNDYLATEDGKKIVDRMDDVQAADCARKANEVITSARSNPRYKTDPAFRSFADSKFFFIWAADNANQYKNQESLKKFLAGQSVNRSGGVVSNLGNNPLNMEALAKYEMEYKWVRLGDQTPGKLDPDAGAKDIKRRRNEIVDEMKAAGDLTDEEAKAYKAIIESTYKSTKQRNAAAAKKAAETAAKKTVDGETKAVTDGAAKTATDGAAKEGAGTSAKEKEKTPEATEWKEGRSLAPGLGQTLMTAALSSNESEPEDGLTEEERRERRMRALYPTMFA